MPFYQSDWKVQGNVYNTEGNLYVNDRAVLTPQSDREDLARLLRNFKAQLDAFEDVPRDRRQEIEAEMEAAAEEAERPDVPKEQVQSRLERVRNTLTGLGD